MGRYTNDIRPPHKGDIGTTATCLPTAGKPIIAEIQHDENGYYCIPPALFKGQVKNPCRVKVVFIKTQIISY